MDDTRSRRLAKLRSHLTNIIPAKVSLAIERALSGAKSKWVRIGNVKVDIEQAETKECEGLIPVGFLTGQESQEELAHMKWLMQKQMIGQDMFLIGAPGPKRRDLVFKYCELVGRPLEYVSISQDTTESDLKQRREIVNGELTYVDSCAIRAAIHGRVLLLEGIEKAERNTVSVLNNLLENREVNCEDGRFLVNPSRYDSMLKDGHTEEEMQAMKLVRVSEKFRCIALGVPTARYGGNPLDPPFRSRFQCRSVDAHNPSNQLILLEDNLDTTEPGTLVVARKMIEAAAVLNELAVSENTGPRGLPSFPQGFEEIVLDYLNTFPHTDPRTLANYFIPESIMVEDEKVIGKVFTRFFGRPRTVYIPPQRDGGGPPRTMVIGKQAPMDTVGGDEDDEDVQGAADPLSGIPLCLYLVDQISPTRPNEAAVRFKMQPYNEYSYEYLKSMREKETIAIVPCGSNPDMGIGGFVETQTNMEQFSQMMQAHAVGDFCLVGERGVGKTALVKYFAKRLGYEVETIPLYREMTAQSILARRTTDERGNTGWEQSRLVTGAINGSLVVLDGIEQLVGGTVATIQMLVHSREARLPDGRRLVGHEEFLQLAESLQLSPEELTKQHKVFPIHPSFRLVCLARPSGTKGPSSPTGTWRDWLSAEVQTMFTFIHVGPLPAKEQHYILRTLAPRVHVDELEKLMRFASNLRVAVDKDEMLNALLTAVSLRSMIRICRRISVVEHIGTGALHQAILAASLARFLPQLVFDTLLSLLKNAGIMPTEHAEDESTLSIESYEGEEANRYKRSKDAVGVVKVGSMVVDVMPPRDVLLIPNILFYDNPRQAASMREMLKDWTSGQHLLLIGNQGVGKNKLADRMLQLLRQPREYIQLHRDTTVQNLTSNPTILDGVLYYEDSPLVRAAREGRILVVDEADKAPTHVTAILKALVEDRSMLLSDGRRIVDPSDHILNPGDIKIHPEFRVIALANRPGFPFHGNDFFREVGDVFACHAIDNPDANSEMYLLKQYGPDVPEDTLRKLIMAFDELRSMSDDGQLSYPYSTRELAAIVKHMQAYPNDGIDRTLRNVFDFDSYSQEEKDLLIEVFARNGVPFSIGASSFHVNTGRTRALAPPKLVETWSLQKSSEIPSPTHKMIKVQGSKGPLTDILRVNQSSKDYMWTLRSPYSETSLGRNERRSTMFTEELFNFKLPQGLILGATKLGNGELVAAVRSHSFLLFQVDSNFSKCTVHDIHSALPSDGTYRLAPNSSHIFTMTGRTETYDNGKRSGGRFNVLVQNPTIGNMMAMDLERREFTFLDIPPSAERKGPKILVVQSPDSDQFLVYQRGYKYLTVVDYGTNMYYSTSNLETNPIRFQVLFPIGRVDALAVNSWLVSHDEKNELYHVGLNPKTGEFFFERLDRRTPAPELAETKTMPTFASSATMSEAPGALATNGGRTSARMIQLRNKNGERTPAFAVNLPNAFEKGGKANIFEVDSTLKVGDTGVEAEDEQNKEKMPRVHVKQLEQSNIMTVIREMPERMVVELDLFDVNNANRRTITVSLEEDQLSANDKDPDLRIRGSGAKVDPVLGTQVRHSPNLAAMKQAISPSQLNMYSMRRATIGEAQQRLFVVELNDTAVCTIDCLGLVRVWLVQDLAIRKAFSDWRKLVGKADDQPLKIMFNDDKEGDQEMEGEGEGGNGSGKGKGQGNGSGDGEGEGEGDGKGKGNGSGEGDGDGSGAGGSGGGQLSQGDMGGNQSGEARGKGYEEIADLPDPSDLDFQEIENPGLNNQQRRSGENKEVEEEIQKAADEMKRSQWLKMLQKIDMSEHDAEKYEKYKEAVKTEIRELRVTLEGLEAKQSERVWIKNQTQGDIDDTRLIDGLTGERAIYKRRADQAPDSSMFQPLPKRMHFVFDLSMSMTRYAADGRLQRSLETAVMILEAVKGFEHKFDIKFTGHSGDSDAVDLGVDFGHFPKNDNERLAVIRKMNAHCQACDSGDTTIPALKKAIESITRDEADDYFVFAISDANLDVYSITADHFERLFNIDHRVHAFVLMIASMGDQAKNFEDRLPGKIFTCLDKTQLPKTIKKMFLAAASTHSNL